MLKNRFSFTVHDENDDVTLKNSNRSLILRRYRNKVVLMRMGNIVYLFSHLHCFSCQYMCYRGSRSETIFFSSPCQIVSIGIALVEWKLKKGSVYYSPFTFWRLKALHRFTKTTETNANGFKFYNLFINNTNAASYARIIGFSMYDNIEFMIFCILCFFFVLYSWKILYCG